ncbi:MAG TPA: YpdA family putative bacillithiol disulfide reductase [Ignavibacteria bacterium]|nr:YpdA family putative bacillithiol disulfide reductase [Ignavibacteria bacterium]
MKKNIIVQEKFYDVLIIGAGPIGLACGIECEKNSLPYIIIEKGCLVNSIFNYPTNMTFFSTSEKIELSGVPFVSHGVKPNRREALEYYRRVKESFGLNVNIYEEVLSITKSANSFKVRSDKNIYNSRFIIIATGYYDNANLLNIPGEDLSKVRHYFDEPHPYSGQNVAVIGAGNSAVDVALELFRVGANVTMIIREDKIKPSIKYWVKPDIENRIKEGSIKTFFESEIIKIESKELTLQQKNKKINIKNDFVFSMTGYHPDFSFLKKAGIKIGYDNTPEFNLKTFESNIKGLYLAGVVCGGINTDRYFIENSIKHSEIIINEIIKEISVRAT